MMAKHELQKRRLADLVQEAVGGCARNWADVIAGHLLDNGVTVPVKALMPETDLTGKCGSCAFAAPAPGSFGHSSCYVRCTNKEHLRIYCRKHHSSGLRQRTVKACKRYKPKGE